MFWLLWRAASERIPRTTSAFGDRPPLASLPPRLREEASRKEPSMELRRCRDDADRDRERNSMASITERREPPPEAEDLNDLPMLLLRLRLLER